MAGNMGTKLPLYGYFDPDADGFWALRNVRPPKPTRAQQLHAMHTMLNYLSRPDVQALASSLILDDFDVSQEEWSGGVIREAGAETKTSLIELLERIQGRGTIVVPTVDDLLQQRTQDTAYAVGKILQEKVTVLAMYDHLAPLSSFTAANQRADSRVFSAMAGNVLRVRTTLEACWNNKDDWTF
jgi:hypothetical protein